MTLPELIQLLQDGDKLLVAANSAVAKHADLEQAALQAQTDAGHAQQDANTAALAMSEKEAQIKAAVDAYFRVGAVPAPAPTPAPLPSPTV